MKLSRLTGSALAALLLSTAFATPSLAASNSQAASPSTEADLIQEGYDEGAVQGALDTAYDLGYEADWTGAVVLDEPIISNNGDVIDVITDVHKALSVDEAFEEGYISEAELNEATAAPPYSIMDTVSCSSSATSYRWVRSGSNVRCFSFPGGTSGVNGGRTVTTLCVRAVGNSYTQARTQYLLNNSTNWSIWRGSSSSSYSCNSFNQPVQALRAEMRRN